MQPYRENNHHEIPQRHYSEPGPVKDDRYDVEAAVNYRFSHPAREPRYQIRWKGYLPSQDQWIHSDEIDEEVKFTIGQEEDLQPILQRRRCYEGHSGPTTRSEILFEIQGKRDRVMQCIMRTSAVRFEEPVADQLFNLFMKD